MRAIIWATAIAFPLVAILAGAGAAATVVPAGALNADDVWTPAGSPYEVQGNITIPAGISLFIEGGVRVEFGGNFSISVNGTLRIGESARPTVTFGMGTGATSPHWSGIAAGANSTLRVEGAASDDAWGGVTCDRCTVAWLANLSVTDTIGAGVTLRDTAWANLSNLTVRGADVGLIIERSENATLDTVQVEAARVACSLMDSPHLSMISVVLDGVDDGLFVRNSSWLSIDLLLTNGSTGMTVGESTRLRVSGLTVWANPGQFGGLVLDSGTTDARFTDFEIHSRGQGVGLFGTDTIWFTNGTIQANSSSAVDGIYNVGLEIVNVSLTGGGNVVDISDSTNIRIASSRILAKGGGGISLSASSWVVIADSTIMNGSTVGIQLFDCHNSSIFQNDVLYTPVLARSVLGKDNVWDDGARGNFWWPQNYSDSDANGIGDQPYNISGGFEQDRYPLAFALHGAPPQISLSLTTIWPEDVPMAAALYVLDLLPLLSIQWSSSCGAAIGAPAVPMTNVTFPTPGTCTLTAIVTNMAQRNASASVEISIQDTTGPVVAVDGPATVDTGVFVLISTANTTDNDPLFPANASALWNVTDPRGESTEFASSVAGASFRLLIPGNHSLRISISDAAGNIGQAIHILLARDITPPTIGPPIQWLVAEDVSSTLGPANVSDDDPLLLGAGSLEWQFTPPGGLPTTMFGWTVTHTFQEPGRIDLTLTLCDPAGHCTVSNGLVVVEDTTPPDVSSLQTFAARSGIPAFLNATVVADNDPDWPTGATFRWVMDFPEGSVEFLGRNIVIEFALPGNVNGRIEVVDAAGNLATASVLIHVSDGRAPLLRAVVPMSVELGTSATFDASATSDDSRPLECRWDFGDGTPVQSGLAVNHSFGRAGSFIVTVEVADASGNTNTSLHTIVVVDTTPPHIEWLLPASSTTPVIITAGSPMDFQVTTMDASGGLSVVFDFGDGTSSAGSAVSHTFARTGRLEVVVTATDGSGNTESLRLPIEVRGQDSAISSGVGLWVGVGAAVTAAAVLLIHWRGRQRTG